MKRRILLAAVATAAVIITACPGSVRAGDGVLPDVLGLFGGPHVDVHSPKSSNQCSHEGCVERTPVERCVHGKLRNDKCCVRYEYVTVPETRYRFHKRLVCKEIPAKGSVPVCTTKNSSNSFETEKWDEKPSGDKKGATLHCKNCVTEKEKAECKHCGKQPGETTIKVHYWTCVKEPYTVYRQVKRQICVSQPHYEHTTTTITKHVCDHCGGCGDPGCKGGCDDKGGCDKGGCDKGK